MRTFLIILLLFMAFLIFLNGSLSGVDLTPNTPGASQSSVQAAAPAEAPQVIMIQESPATNRTGGGSVPVTGGCSDPYTVQPGDSLSQIAVVCDTSLAVIRQANPHITDANLIYPGQQLRIPNAIAAQPSQAAPVQVSPTAIVPVTGALPLIPAGTGLQIKGIGYPANTPVNVAIGPQTQGYTVVANGVTDADGNLTTRITVPEAHNAQTPYGVVIATTGTPPVQAMSQPFLIGPSGSQTP
jgi:LysM repeat protein